MPDRDAGVHPADRHRPVEFGIFPSPAAADRAVTIGLVQRAEELGIELVGIQDHPYQRRFLDTFTLLTHLAAVTTRIRLFPAVAHLPLRPVAMLAKQAASIDVLSEGRFELGLGAGGFDEASQAMGAPSRTAGEKLAAVEEAIEVLRTFWSVPQHGITYSGAHVRLGGVKAGPPPAHDIGIWIGAYGPRMLELTGRLADGWLPSAAYLPPDRLGDAQRRIDEAAVAAGRDPSTVRRAYNLNGSITSSGPVVEWLHGPVDHWVEELMHLVAELGMDTFVLWSDNGEGSTQVDAWAEVAAGVRGRLGTG